MKEENPVELDELSSFSIDGVEYWYGWNSGVAYFFHTPITSAALNFGTKVDLKCICELLLKVLIFYSNHWIDLPL